MQSYFDGWQRKAGAVTLGLACVLSAMWVRSFFALECVAVDVGRWTHIFVADDGKVFWWRSGGWSNVPHFGRGIVREEGYYLVLTGWAAPQAYGLGLPLEHAAILHYWLLVIPLTLLSAYLLLWTPQAQRHA